MIAHTHRGWFQCPDTGEEVCVKVYPAPTHAQCLPTDRSPENADTDAWCGRFNSLGVIGLQGTRAVLHTMGVDPRYDVNWEND